jgi:hypothetical protein
MTLGETSAKKKVSMLTMYSHYIEDFREFVPVFCKECMYSFHRVPVLKSPLHSDFI